MYQIRSNTFETNSSSTHSICISKHPVDLTSLPSKIYFCPDEFSWECRRADPVSYLYTAIVLSPDHEDLLNTLKSTLSTYGITCEFEPVEYDPKYHWPTEGSIDHEDEAVAMAHKVVNDPDRLIRYLFSPDTYIQTGNDNCCNCGDDCSRCTIANGGWEKRPDGNWVRIQKADDDYEYFFKGN